MGKIIDTINPLTYYTPEQYSAFWQTLFATVLSGFWAKVLVIFFVVLGLWVVIKRDRIMAGLVIFLIAVFIAYGSSLLRIINIRL